MALFVKTWRLRKVTRFGRNSTVKCQHVVWPLILAFLLLSGVFAAWLLHAPPVFLITEAEMVTIDEDGNSVIESQLQGYCDFTPEDNPAYMFILFLLLVTSALLGYWMSRQIPASVPEELNDGKQMRLLYLVHFAILFCFSVLYFVSRSIFATGTFMGIATLVLVFPICVANIALLIAPKCLSVYHDNRAGIGSGNIRVSGVIPSGPIAPGGTRHGSSIATFRITDGVNNPDVDGDEET